MMGFGVPMMLMMLLGMTVWIIVLVVLIWALIRWLTHRAAGSSGPERLTPADARTPMEILQQRYARGEIDHATFEQMCERLQATSSRQHASGRGDA